MDIKSHVSQATASAAAAVGYPGGVAAGTTERWILSLPRLLKSATDEKLVNLAGKSLAGGVAYSISLKTGKVLSPFLVDRRLTTVGKVAFGVGLAAYGVVGLLAAHELYVRTKPTTGLSHEEADDMIRRLVGL